MSVATGRAGGEEVLTRAWTRPPGLLGWLAAVNHKDVGMRFIVTGFAFFLVGGILALLMRTQLAAPESGVLGAEAFNEALTLHGTTMMFLFAVPILEGLAMYLLPLMIGTRDLPFPRMNSFGYWCYLFGGLLVFAGLIGGEASDNGWFAYVPLSGPVHSPDQGMDFWLLGVTLVEIAGIIGAIELVTAFLIRRAPGMSLNRIPIFGWAVFVMAAMMIFAFPVLVVAGVLLEAERVLGTRFFDPGAGGDPLLWQHLFWFFGHPEVYIIQLPASGILVMVVIAFARRGIAGYSYVVAALVAIGLLSFALWVHHMFTTGLSLLGLSFFAATSFLIAIPQGVQVFSVLATLWRGKPSLRTPLLFVLGFVFVFLIGGITGVMVAAVPFDWQVHDTYFVVAHFHYVLIGGMVFPVFGGIYYWFPKWTGRMLGERLGQASFWTMLAGFNIAFFPHHALGLDGMVRRIYTYRETDGWATMNLISTVGAYILAAGVLLTVINMALALRRRRSAASNPWSAGTLEWAASSPPRPYNFQRMPVVAGREPLWEESPRLDDVTRKVIDELAVPELELREALETGPVDGRLRRVAQLPGPSLWPLFAVLGLLVSLIGIIASSLPMVVAGAAAAAVFVIVWAAGSPDAQPGGPTMKRSLPVRATGAGLVGVALSDLVLLTAHGSLVFAYCLLAIHADAWPPGDAATPGLALALLAAVALAGTLAGTLLARRGGSGAIAAGLGLGMLATVAFAALAGVWLAGLDADPTADAYGSIVYALVIFHLVLAAVVAVVLAVAIWIARRAGPDGPLPVAVRICPFLAAVALATWIVTAGLLHFVPQL